MMDNDQKLRLVPTESLNKLAKMLTDQKNEKELLLSILNPDQHAVLQKKRKIDKSLEEGDTENLSTNMIQFNRVQGELIKNSEEERKIKKKALEEQGKPKENGQNRAGRIDPRQRILELMGTKNISVNNGLLHRKGRSIGVNAEDFLEDITRQARKRFNLDQTQREKALTMFANAGLPASYIVNNQIKQQYIEMRNKLGTPQPSESSGADSSGSSTYSLSRSPKFKKLIRKFETPPSTSSHSYYSRKQKSKK